MTAFIGPVILDLVGTELTPDEHELLQHPLIGGVILFTRNYQSPQQIAELCLTIRQAKKQPFLIAVDHEGGRVQRFRSGFTRIPSMGLIGQLYESSPQKGLEMSEACGWVMASELLASGINLSFAPVLDLDKKNNPVVGDRAFHRDPKIIITLAKAFIKGMHQAGMAATGKHFPGHGSVQIDSHVGSPVDERDWETIAADDLIPFAELIHSGISAIMPAHIIFPKIDDKAVGFSKIWLQDILRRQLNFSGVIFSDDLNMKGADITPGSYAGRAQAALAAGCDMILICNNRPAAIEIIEHLPHDKHAVEQGKYKTLLGKELSQSFDLDLLKSSTGWREKARLIMNFSTQEAS